jgi:hypothetical protein
MYVTDELMEGNILLEKLSSVIYKLSVSPSVINISMDLQTEKIHQKNLHALFRWYIYR